MALEIGALALLAQLVHPEMLLQLQVRHPEMLRQLAHLPKK
jgi:hypothetical protein